MNNTSNNCSIISNEIVLWGTVAGYGLAILIGPIAMVMVVRLKLHWKEMYRLVLYQLVSTILSSFMFIISGVMYKAGNHYSINHNDLWLYLALWLALLQIYVVCFTLNFHCKNAKTWHKCFRCACVEYKYFVEVTAIISSALLSAFTIGMSFIQPDELFNLKFSIIIPTLLMTYAIIFFVVTMCIQCCRAEMEMKLLY